MFRKLLRQRLARPPFRRRRLAFEPLEPRLLLSADLVPAESVLEIAGTDGDDFLLLRQTQSRLVAVLNDQAFEFSLEGIERIKVGLGAGADTMILEGSAGLPAVQIDLGEGKNGFDAVLENPDGILEVLAGGGDDALRVEAQWRGDSIDEHPDFLWLPTFNLGAGNDTLEFNAVMGIDPQPFLPKIKIEAAVDAGSGNDIARVDTLLGSQSAEAVYRLDMGDGDNEAHLQFGDGIPGARLPSGESHVRTEYRSGAGADTVSAKYTMFLADGAPVRARALDLDIATGGGKDDVQIEVGQTDLADPGPAAALDLAVKVDTGNGEDTTRSNVYAVWLTTGFFEVDTGAGNDTVMFNPEQLAINKDVNWSVDIDTGAGDDCLLVDTSDVVLGEGSRVDWLFDLGAGDDDATHIRANWEIDAGVDYRWAVDLGEGDNTLKALVNGQSVGEGASLAYEFSGGDGIDDIAIALTDLTLAASAAFTMKTDAGDGDNLLRHELVHVVQQTDGTPPPDDGRPVLLGIFTGTGEDVVDLNVHSGIEPTPFLPAIQLDLSTGDGDDTALVGLLLPAVQAAREAAHRANIDLGDGDDTAVLSIETANAGAGINPCAIINIDAGLGGDDVQVEAMGDFGVFDLRVDLGADASGDVVPVDQVSLNYTAIKFEYNTSATYQYQSGDVAKAVYHAGLRSDGDLVQAVSEKDMIGGTGTDQVNVSVGANRSETVGANLTISVGGSSTESARSDLSAAYSLRTAFGGSGGATIEGEVHAKGDSLEDSVTLDLSMNDDATRAGFANVSGIGQEITPAEYRGGAAVDNDQNPLTIDIGLAGVDAFNLLTGDAADEIDVDLRYPTVPVPALTIKSGSGNDAISGTVLWSPSAFKLILDTGEGDDTVNLDYTEAAAIATGAGMGGLAEVKTFSGASAVEGNSLLPYGSGFTGGVRVATGDVNNDGVADIITAAGPGGGPHVKVIDGRTGAELRSFVAYDRAFTGGVYVAAGDINGDGFDDIITGADAGGGPHVKVFDGQSGAELRSFLAYSSGFTGGVRVASGDVNGDGFDDIITGAGAGGAPHVRVFDGRSNAELRSFFAYDSAFGGGVFVAAGDVDGDGFADLITGAGAGGGPHVRVFSGATSAELRSFFAYTPSFTGGVRVAAGDVNGDGRADIVTGAGPGAAPHVKVFDGAIGAQVRSFFAYDPAFTGGVFVAAGDLDNDAPGTFDLAVDLGGGNDTIETRLATGGSRTDRIDALLGDGADRFALDWSGALRDPSVNLRVDVNVDPGLLPEIGDEVLVSFQQGDPDRPLVLGTVWNSKDQPPPDDGTPPPDDEHLHMLVSNTRGVLSSSLDLQAGAGDDEVTYFVRGVLDTTATELISATIDLGEGTNMTTITYTGLEAEGPKKLAPISIDVRGGRGEDDLRILGTEGNDRFAVAGNAVALEGVGRVGFSGIEFVEVRALGGNDRIDMSAVDPGVRWLLDGGAGRDRFVADFDWTRVAKLEGFELIQTQKPKKGDLTDRLLREVRRP